MTVNASMRSSFRRRLTPHAKKSSLLFCHHHALIAGIASVPGLTVPEEVSGRNLGPYLRAILHTLDTHATDDRYKREGTGTWEHVVVVGRGVDIEKLFRETDNLDTFAR